ncbi:hypothetical protein AZF00_06285 [Zhongshania aliphaticivorans]|jgi:hypothetical protein|uniref:Uncharacterized protein n=1 Tax=Zhongshania aliphaticivorans TaxID=1470434 RepID=A0A127M3U7_9GAMM|nr:hypothetical protein AZF00_06285 [Zhongshania aliphaticivorans]
MSLIHCANYGIFSGNRLFGFYPLARCKLSEFAILVTSSGRGVSQALYLAQFTVFWRDDSLESLSAGVIR